MKIKNAHKNLFLILTLGIITIVSFSLGCTEEEASLEPAENVSQASEPLENTSEQPEVTENLSQPNETTSNTSQSFKSVENASQQSLPSKSISQQSKPAKSISEPLGNSGGASGQPEPSENNFPQSGSVENTPHPSDGDSDEDIADIEWQWVSFQQANLPENKTLVPNPESYTLTFFSDGTYYIIADCNSGSGTYTQEGNELNLGQPTMTLIACGTGSMDSQYLALLSEVKSAFIEDGQLVLYTGNANDKMFFINKNA